MPKALSLGSELKRTQREPPPRSTKPVWAGPCGDDPQGGVTQSLLGRYLSCPERFRVHVMEGLRPADRFMHRMEYGNMWHLCEEALASMQNPELQQVSMSGMSPVGIALTNYAKQLCLKYPLQQEEIDHWYRVCKVQFPIYVEWWSKHPDVVARRPLFQEEKFDVPYSLPSGRVVRLRGKWDSVDLVNGQVWLKENKSKGEIDEQQLVRQLSFDLQTMTYLVALLNTKESISARQNVNNKDLKVNEARMLTRGVAGVIYNVVLRPLSGGKGSITQLKGRGKEKKGRETKDEFYARLGELIRSAVGNEWGVAKDQHYFFRRWEVLIDRADVEKFRRQCLDPVLENLCDDFEWWNFGHEDVWDWPYRSGTFPVHARRHFRLPYGIFNPLAEGRSTELDNYLDTGSTIGLQRLEELFPELR